MAKGRPRVLVVEDNLLIAMEVETLVSRCGCMVVGPAGDVGAALAAARDTQIDVAVLDVNLGDERVWPVADLLRERGIPFVLATGYDSTELPPRFKDCPLLSKPITVGALNTLLKRIGLFCT